MELKNIIKQKKILESQISELIDDFNIKSEITISDIEFRYQILRTDSQTRCIPEIKIKIEI